MMTTIVIKESDKKITKDCWHHRRDGEDDMTDC